MKELLRLKQDENINEINKKYFLDEEYAQKTIKDSFKFLKKKHNRKEEGNLKAKSKDNNLPKTVKKKIKLEKMTEKDLENLIFN
jgi:hypothetical protein